MYPRNTKKPRFWDTKPGNEAYLNNYNEIIGGGIEGKKDKCHIILRD